MPDLRLIAGSGRSGTTWVLDALAVANNLRPVFEPLNPYASRIGSLYAHRAIAPDENHPELLTFYRDVCAGRQARFWTQYRRQRRWLAPPIERLRSRDDFARLRKAWEKFLMEAPHLAWMSTRKEPLVKCIWSNLMLGWLARNLPCSIALIIRHPGAVIESELRSGWNPNYAIERFKTDERLRDLTADRYTRLLTECASPVEALTVRWIIENQHAVEMAEPYGLTVVHYEHLRMAPDLAWKELVAALKLSSVPGGHLLKRPSQQTAPRNSDVAPETSTAPRWMASLSVQDKAAIQRVLDSARFDIYSMSDAEPLKEPVRSRGYSHRGMQ